MSMPNGRGREDVCDYCGAVTFAFNTVEGNRGWFGQYTKDPNQSIDICPRCLRALRKCEKDFTALYRESRLLPCVNRS